MSRPGFTACGDGDHQQLDSSPLLLDWAVPVLLLPRWLKPLGNGGLRAPATYATGFLRPGTIDVNCLHLNIHYKQNKQREVWKMSAETKPTCSQQIMLINSAGSSCGCHTRQPKKDNHTHLREAGCHLKAKTSLAAVLSWHAVHGKASEILTWYPCCTQTSKEEGRSHRY